MSDNTPMNDDPSGRPPLGGLNPADLLRQGAADDTQVEGASRLFKPPSVEELAGVFPQFDILELIGQGGMGAVYKVRQRELGRIVALKILPKEISSDPSFAGQFAREAKALAQLNHPNIVTLYEFGQAQGLYYILMEYVDGASLRRLMDNGRLAPREALAIVPQICDALQYAHDRKIIHRDIKPENILLDRQGRVKVADFGLAKLVADAHATTTESPGAPVTSHETLLMKDGKIMGTPAYMAPEQRETPSAVDHRADIYALGVVFYQMLTGELPGKPLEMPSRKVQIDVKLDEVVLRALEKNPDRRYAQVSMMKTRVEEAATANGTIAPPHSTNWRPLKIGAGIFFVIFLFFVLPFVFLGNWNQEKISSSSMVTPVEDFLKNLPPEITLTSYYEVSQAEIAGYERGFGGRIERVSNAIITTEGRTFQINTIHASDDTSAKNILNKAQELFPFRLRKGNLVVAFFEFHEHDREKNDLPIELMRKTAVRLGLLNAADVATMLAPKEDFLKNLPSEITLQNSYVVPPAQIADFEKKFGVKITNISNSVITVDGKTFQINAIHTTDKSSVGVVLAHLGNPFPYAFHGKENIVIEYYGMGKELSKDLVIKTSRLLGFFFYPETPESVSIAATEDFLKNLPPEVTLESCKAVSAEGVVNYEKKFGAKIDHANIACFNFEGDSWQINTYHAVDEAAAKTIFENIPGKMFPLKARKGNRVIEYFVEPSTKKSQKEVENAGMRFVALLKVNDAETMKDSSVFVEDFLKNPPSEIVLLTGSKAPPSFIGRFEEKLGGKINSASNSVVSVNSMTFQINAIHAADETSAKTILDNMQRQKPFPYTLRKGNLVIEYYGMGKDIPADLVRKTSSLLGLIGENVTPVVPVEDFLKNLPPDITLESSYEVPRAEIADFEKSFGRKIDRMSGSLVIIGGTRFLIHAIHAPDDASAEDILNCRGELFPFKLRKGNLVVWYSPRGPGRERKNLPVGLILNTSIRLGLVSEAIRVPKEAFLKNLPPEITLESSDEVPSSQIADFEKKLGAKITRMSNSIITFEGRTFQINAIHTPDETSAQTILRRMRNASISLRKGTLVIEYYGRGEVLASDLIKKTSRLLGFVDAKETSVVPVEDFLKNLPPDIQLLQSHSLPRPVIQKAENEFSDAKIEKQSLSFVRLDGFDIPIDAIHAADDASARKIAQDFTPFPYGMQKGRLFVRYTMDHVFSTPSPQLLKLSYAFGLFSDDDSSEKPTNTMGFPPEVFLRHLPSNIQLLQSHSLPRSVIQKTENEFSDAKIKKQSLSFVRLDGFDIPIDVIHAADDASARKIAQDFTPFPYGIQKGRLFVRYTMDHVFSTPSPQLLKLSQAFGLLSDSDSNLPNPPVSSSSSPEKAVETKLTAAKQKVEAARDKYNKGVGGYDAVLDAEIAAAEAEIQLESIRKNQATSGITSTNFNSLEKAAETKLAVAKQKVEITRQKHDGGIGGYDAVLDAEIAVAETEIQLESIRKSRAASGATSNNIDSAKSSPALARAVALAEENLKVQRARFDGGQINSLALYDAEDRVNQFKARQTGSAEEVAKAKVAALARQIPLLKQQFEAGESTRDKLSNTEIELAVAQSELENIQKASSGNNTSVAQASKPATAAKKQNDGPTTAEAFAWLALVDAGKYPEAYAKLSKFKRTQESESRWTYVSRALRESLGAVVERKFLYTERYTGSLHFIFETDFANARNSKEILVFPTPLFGPDPSPLPNEYLSPTNYILIAGEFVKNDDLVLSIVMRKNQLLCKINGQEVSFSDDSPPVIKTSGQTLVELFKAERAKRPNSTLRFVTDGHVEQEILADTIAQTQRAFNNVSRDSGTSVVNGLAKNYPSDNNSVAQASKPATAVKDQNDGPTATEALAWLALVDAGKYPEAYAKLSEFKRTQESESRWTYVSRALRELLGAVVERKFLYTERHAGSLHFIFETDFANARNSKEILVFPTPLFGPDPSPLPNEYLSPTNYIPIASEFVKNDDLVLSIVMRKNQLLCKINGQEVSFPDDSPPVIKTSGQTLVELFKAGRAKHPNPTLRFATDGRVEQEILADIIAQTRKAFNNVSRDSGTSVVNGLAKNYPSDNTPVAQATQAAPADKKQNDGPTTAEAFAWLALIDNGKYKASFMMLPEDVRKINSNWPQEFMEKRQALGTVISRRLKTNDVVTALDNQTGETLKLGIRTLKFETDFTNKQEVTESVSFRRKADHTWEPLGYAFYESKTDMTKDALAWLALSDAGKYRESYAGFAEFAKKMITEADYGSAMNAVRKPLGDVISRKLKTSETHKTLPGLPDGDYRVLTFATEFSAKKNASETVTLVKTQDGAWLITGYVIQ